MFAKQQSFDADILIEVGPVDSIAGAADLKISAFRGRAICETRIPPDWNGDSPAVLEID
jgi:hypothetical protein